MAEIYMKRVCTTYEDGRVVLIEYQNNYETVYSEYLDRYFLARRNPARYYDGDFFRPYCTSNILYFQTYQQAEAVLLVYLAWENHPNIIAIGRC